MFWYFNFLAVYRCWNPFVEIYFLPFSTFTFWETCGKETFHFRWGTTKFTSSGWTIFCKHCLLNFGLCATEMQLTKADSRHRASNACWVVTLAMISPALLPKVCKINTNYYVFPNLLSFSRLALENPNMSQPLSWSFFEVTFATSPGWFERCLPWHSLLWTRYAGGWRHSVRLRLLDTIKKKWTKPYHMNLWHYCGTA